MRSGREVLFVMPELDRATYDFRRFFEKSVMDKYNDFKHLYSIARIEKADHTFSRPVSSNRLFQITAGWLRHRIKA
jgi:hypothetical protein